MVIPSIDLQSGNAVQLIGGKELAIDAGDPRPIATSFGRVGEIAVVDLDAALSVGSNRQTILDLLSMAECRVGGGIRDVETARFWLHQGAAKIVLGTAARPEVLKELPAERVIAALDAVEGEVVVEGWTTRTGRSILECMHELRPYVGGFLVTFVEKEGRMQGTNLDQVEALLEAANGAELTIAGGVTTAEDIAALDRMGARSQIGMALYSGTLSLGDAFTAPLISDRPDGLFPTVVTNEIDQVLGLVYSSKKSIARALSEGKGIYHSRKRGIWEKGATSGQTQELIRVQMDCDRDALQFVVRQHGTGFCHLDEFGCFGPSRGLTALAHTIQARIKDAPPGSYTRKLLDDPALLASKLAEESGELAEAGSAEEAVWECADLLYFAMVKLYREGGRMVDVERMLDRRALEVIRRSEKKI